MICRNGLPGGSPNKALRELLRDARAMLAQAQRMHVYSHDIGRAQQAGMPEIMADQMRIVRTAIENSDRLCADIDKHLTGNKP